MTAPLEARVAVVENRVDNIEQETMHTRTRLHDLESDRSTLRLLSRQMGEIVSQTETVAQRAAERAVELARKRNLTAHRAERTQRVQLIGLYVAVGGLLVAVIGLATGVLHFH